MERTKAADLLHTGLGRYEVFDFSGERLGHLKAFLKAKQQPYSFHVPFSRPLYFPHSGVSTFFLNESSRMRNLSYRLINSTLYYAKVWEADFIVTHLVWKDDSKDRKKVKVYLRNAQSKFCELSDRYGVPINIEFGGYSGQLHKPVQYVEFVSEHPGLGICIDIGHTFLIAQARNRNYLHDIEIMAPYTRSLHVWNTKNIDYCKKHNHVPVHPLQKTSEGWIDVKKTLEIITSLNKKCAIVFEYNHTYYDDIPATVKEGMDWVKDIVGEMSWHSA